MTNELITTTAWDRHNRIVGLRKLSIGAFFELGKELYYFEKEQQYKELDYVSFNQYLADIDISRRTAFQLKGIFETFILNTNLTSAPDALLSAGVTKLDMIRPVVNDTNMEEWINKASTLSRSDLKKEVHDETYAELIPDAPYDFKIFNVWNFAYCDPQLGLNYPGRIPGQVIQHLLYYYTEPGDLIVDLFGGGGVTVDACMTMNRKPLVYDIDPMRPDIRKHDATNSYPPEARGAKLVFLDPPYWKQKRGSYTDHATNLSNMDVDLFHDELTSIVQKCLNNAEYVALLIGATQKEFNLVDHAAEMISRIGVPYHRIQVPYTTQVYGGNHINIAKQKKHWLNLTRDLMIWRGNSG